MTPDRQRDLDLYVGLEALELFLANLDGILVDVMPELSGFQLHVTSDEAGSPGDIRSALA